MIYLPNKYDTETESELIICDASPQIPPRENPD